MRVIQEEATLLFSVGETISYEKAFKRVDEYLGYSPHDYFSAVIELILNSSLDFKVESWNHEIAFQIIEPTNRNLLGIGTSLTRSGAAAAAFYEFFH